jgi:hypothetical protein
MSFLMKRVASQSSGNNATILVLSVPNVVVRNIIGNKIKKVMSAKVVVIVKA